MLWDLKRTSTRESRNSCLHVRILAPDTSASKKTPGWETDKQCVQQDA